MFAYFERLQANNPEYQGKTDPYWKKAMSETPNMCFLIAALSSRY